MFEMVYDMKVQWNHIKIDPIRRIDTILAETAILCCIFDASIGICCLYNIDVCCGNCARNLISFSRMCSANNTMVGRYNVPNVHQFININKTDTPG